MKVLWYSTDDTSRLSTGSRRPEQVEGRLAALLLNRIAPLFSFVAPCHAGASPVSMPHVTFTTGPWR